MAKKSNEKSSYKTTRGERISYYLYFLGQNIFYGLVAINIQTFFSDVGITVAAIAIIMLITKVWDAVNDPLMGILIDKVRFKKGRFLPWLRMSLIALAVTSVGMFLLPVDSSASFKIAWATIAYIAWSMSYTVCDVPIFILPTSMTDNVEERGSMLTFGRFFAMIGIAGASVTIPILQARIGWLAVAIIFCVIAVISMLPLCFKGKERKIVRPEEKVTLKQMIRYVIGNKYLLIFYLSMFVGGITNFSQYITIYFARHNLGNQDMAGIISLLAMIPMLIVGAILPSLIKKTDKFNLYFFCQIATAVFGVIRYVGGYADASVFYVLYIIQCFFTGASNILLFTFTLDCLEYGTYHTGERAEGVVASVQTFFSKLVGSVSGPIAMMILAAFGFISGENVVQPESVADGIWLCMSLFPAFGALLSAGILWFYKLRSKDVQIMAKYNEGTITKEEADSQLAEKYGPAATLINMSVSTDE
ncbi:MAG: MFS transporter [Suipraeoptans sp.]